MVLLLLTGTIGCGMGGSTENAQGVSAKDYVYKYETFDYEDGKCTTILKGGDRLYAYGYNWNEEGSNAQIDICILNLDGSVKGNGQIILAQEESMYEIAADGKGHIYGVKYKVSVDNEDNYNEIYSLIKLTEQGEEIFSIDLQSMPELASLNTEDYFYAGSIMLKDDFVYVSIMDRYVKFDENGKFIKILEGADWEANSVGKLYALENGKVATISYEDNGAYVSYVDLETGVFTQKTKLPGISYEYSVYPGSGYDFYLVNSYGVYGYNVGEESMTQVMNYINSDFGSYNLYNMAAVSETEFFATYDEMESGKPLVGRFTKVDPADVKEKNVIVLACNNLDWTIRMAVIDFNKNNDNYKISIQDYASLYGDENDYLAGINRLNTDIISGKIPDIIVVDSNMPINSYIAKGLLEDLKPYLEKDEELDINNYMPNILEAFSVDGKLYQLVPCYSIRSMAAKASVVGAESGWTVQEAMELWEKAPEGTELLSMESRENILINSMSVAGSQFVDWNTGNCYFDSEEFVQFLHYLAMFPEEIDHEAYNDEFWANYESMWRDDKVIAQMMTLYDFSNYNYLEKGTFGEDITLIGYPSGNREGSAIVPEIQLAMSAKSANKEGVWEFLRYFLTDEYQNEGAYGLPLSIKKLDEMAEAATKVPVYIDEEGNEVESPEFFYIGGMEIPIDPMTQEEVADLKEQIYSITNVYNYDQKLIQIVQEESAGFFSGQKSAEEVAKIVQSRAQIYINENR